MTTFMKTDELRAVACIRLVRAQCAKAIRDYRQYRKIHPEAFQVWACSERKGAMLMARRITRLLGRPNDKDQAQPQNHNQPSKY